MMNAPDLLIRNQATLKLLFVAVLSLAMLIPLSMVRAIVTERQGMQAAAAQTIADRWGGRQSVGGLVAITPTVVARTTERGRKMEPGWRANALSDLTIEARMTTQWRYLGIYHLPVYITRLSIRGRIDWSTLEGGETMDEVVFWLPLGDVRGVREISDLRLGELEIPADPLSLDTNGYAGLQFTVTAGERPRAGNEYAMDITLAGSDSLSFLPLADRSRITLDADWPHPEFIGHALPSERSISGDGVRAVWQLLGINRPYAGQWVLADGVPRELDTAGFGVRLETPVDAYQRSERSVKYGFLFIALTFFTLFLFEVMSGRPLHPVPYVLTGSAMAVFYLVLLALSEFLPFPAAFLAASLLLVLLITAYTGVVLGHRSRGYLVGAMMGLTYALLYVLISAQQAALLVGSLSLLAAIATLMYLTRRVDWYAYGTAEAQRPAEGS
jgi:inner membrane protein